MMTYLPYLFQAGFLTVSINYRETDGTLEYRKLFSAIRLVANDEKRFVVW